MISSRKNLIPDLDGHTMRLIVIFVMKRLPYLMAWIDGRRLFFEKMGRHFLILIYREEIYHGDLCTISINE